MFARHTRALGVTRCELLPLVRPEPISAPRETLKVKTWLMWHSIAAARSLIPEPIEEVERLREYVANLQRLVGNPQVVAAIAAVDPDNPIEVEVQ